MAVAWSLGWHDCLTKHRNSGHTLSPPPRIPHWLHQHLGHLGWAGKPRERWGWRNSLSSALPSQTVACPGRADALLYAHPCKLSFPALVNFLLPILYQINQNSETQPEITGYWNHMTLVAHVKTGRKPPMQIIPIWLEKGDRACDRPQKTS